MTRLDAFILGVIAGVVLIDAILTCTHAELIFQ